MVKIMEQYLDYMISHYGYFGIFGALVLGIVGLPIPDETLLTYAGYSVYEGELNYILTVLIAFLGSATGITLSYGIGYKLGLPFLKKLGPKIHITQERTDRTRKLFKKYGNALIFIGYFIPGVRHLTAYIAGISNLEFPKFMVFAYSGAFVWTLTFISLGHELGERWGIVKEYMHRYSTYFLIPCLAAVIAIVALRYIKKGKATS